jgi:hypothetical protein
MAGLHSQEQLPLSSLKVERLSWYGLGTFTPTFLSLCYCVGLEGKKKNRKKKKKKKLDINSATRTFIYKLFCLQDVLG